jgi:hypothetical protein
VRGDWESTIIVPIRELDVLLPVGVNENPLSEILWAQGSAGTTMANLCIAAIVDVVSEQLAM